jgi:hypothetical protein
MTINSGATDTINYGFAENSADVNPGDSIRIIYYPGSPAEPGTPFTVIHRSVSDTGSASNGSGFIIHGRPVVLLGNEIDSGGSVRISIPISGIDLLPCTVRLGQIDSSGNLNLLNSEIIDGNISAEITNTSPVAIVKNQ